MCSFLHVLLLRCISEQQQRLCSLINDKDKLKLQNGAVRTFLLIKIFPRKIFCVDNNCTLTKNSGAQESEFCEAGMANIDSFFSYSDILKRGRIKIFFSGAQYSEKDSCSFVDVV